MKRTILVLTAFLIACTAGIAFAEDAPAKRGSRPALKAQPMKAVQVVPNTYGTTSSSFHRMGASEFTPIEIPGVDDYTDTFYSVGSSDIRRYAKIANAYFLGTPHLPSGALVTAIYVNDCVADGSTDSVGGNVYSCNYYGSGCVSLSAIDTFTGCGYDFVDLSASGYVVDNSPFGNQLVIRLRTVATDGSDSFSGVTVEYVLQVSPAPAVASFLDVPTSHPQFQFIEALVAAGVTAGCGGGNYCPDANLTRGQMAVFLSKALGLHFR